MPRGDRTGPLGEGPMTGRGMGLCAGYSMPGFETAPVGARGGYGFGGRGFPGGGRGYPGAGGRGRGFRNMYYRTGLAGWQRMPGYGSPPVYGGQPPYAEAPTREEELNALKDEAAYLERELNAVKERMQTLESSEGEQKE